MGSFKLKLVAYFLLLSLLPIAAAFWGFTQVAGQSETRRVDARLQAGLRGAPRLVPGAARRAPSARRRRSPGRADLSARAREPRPARRSSTCFATSLERSPSTASTASASAQPADLRGDPRRPRSSRARGSSATSPSSVPFDATLVEMLRARSRASAPADSLVDPARPAGSSPRRPTVARARCSRRLGQTKTITVGSDRFRDARRAGGRRRPERALRRAQPAVADRRRELELAQPPAARPARSRSRSSRSSRTSRAARSCARCAASPRPRTRSRAAGSRERVPVRGRDEFALLGTAFNDMANQLAGAARRARGRARPPPRRDHPLRRGARRDPRRRAAAARDRRGRGRGHRRDRRAPRRRRRRASSRPATRTRTASGSSSPLTAGRTTFGTLTLVGDVLRRRSSG